MGQLPVPRTDLALVQFEYGIPVYDLIGIFEFYDAGTVGNSAGELTPRLFRRDAGLGLSVRPDTWWRRHTTPSAQVTAANGGTISRRFLGNADVIHPTCCSASVTSVLRWRRI